MKIEEVKNFYKNKRVLITGHTGFIGSWLTKWLTMLDANVCGFALDPPTQPNLYETTDLSSKILDVRGDIRDAEILRKTLTSFRPEILIHLAAQPIVITSYNDPVETFDINVTGMVNLLNEIRKVKSVKELIVVTSDKSYKNMEWVYPYRESDILGGKDPYSASKSCQEIVIDMFRETYFVNSNVGISSVRAGNVLGGGDWAKNRLIPDLVRGAMDNQTTQIRNPESIRPWQHVLEPISGILALGEKLWSNTKFSGPWNFGPEHKGGVTVLELTKKFLSYYGVGKYEIRRGSDFMESQYLNLDISKAKKELNWAPRFDFDETVRETAEWYKRYSENPDSIDQITEKQILEYSSLE
ncbi:MAG: CDP-glucose 4,6-dehydratase [Thermoplasmatales archaeon]